MKTKNFAISLRKNVTIPANTNTDNGNYDVETYKVYRRFATRDAARSFKRHYVGSPLVIINTATNQVVR